MTRRVVITGMGGVTAFGENWQDVSARLLAYENCGAQNAGVAGLRRPAHPAWRAC